MSGYLLKWQQMEFTTSGILSLLRLCTLIANLLSGNIISDYNLIFGIWH